METPTWFALGMAIMLGVIVARYGRGFLQMWRDMRDGRVDPDDLWPPGRRDPGDPPP